MGVDIRAYIEVNLDVCAQIHLERRREFFYVLTTFDGDSTEKPFPRGLPLLGSEVVKMEYGDGVGVGKPSWLYAHELKTVLRLHWPEEVNRDDDLLRTLNGVVAFMEALNGDQFTRSRFVFWFES